MIKLEKAETIGAFIAETISGTSLGAVTPPKEYYPIIREICDRYDIIFIADEVMCGMGRTGKWFAIEHYGVVPDMIVTGKGASGGYLPIGVMATSAKIVDTIKEQGASFQHGHGYTNTPMTAACALAVLRYIKKHNLIEQSRIRGEYLGKQLEKLHEFPFVGDIRGLGGFRAIEFVQDKKTKAPFPRSVKFVETLFKKLFDKGVVAYTGTGCADGIDGDVLMISPPFVIAEEDIDEVIDVLRESLRDMEKEVKV
jgi:adenosylmethionine-8-amino-7-oxononanoate aminotransferase